MITLPPAPGEIAPSAAALLRNALLRAGFDERVTRALGPLGDPGWRAYTRSMLARLSSDASRTLARFFIIGDEVSEQSLAPALGGAEVLAELHRARFAIPAGESLWRCPLLVLPIGGVLAASDPIEDPGSEDVPEQYILPVGRTTRYVDDLAIRVPCDLAVDMGCGQGFHAARSLAHAKRCIATDINPRAIEFARASAALNGAGDRVECRIGSFFKPLGDCTGKVDLLTCNPPFIIYPGAKTTAVVSPMEGDEMLEHLVLNTPNVLRENAWAALIGIWENKDASDWPARVAAWVAGLGCDALALRFHTFTNEEYLRSMIAPEKQQAAEPGWRELCRKRGFAAVTIGGIVLHKRRGPNWFRAIPTLINQRTGPANDQVRAMCRTQTALSALSAPGDLLSLAFRVAPGWRFDPALPAPRTPPAGATPGLALPLQYLAHYEPLLPFFMGDRPARDVLADLHRSGRLAVPPDHPSAIAMLRSLAESGILNLVDESPMPS